MLTQPHLDWAAAVVEWVPRQHIMLRPWWLPQLPSPRTHNTLEMSGWNPCHAHLRCPSMYPEVKVQSQLQVTISNRKYLISRNSSVRVVGNSSPTDPKTLITGLNTFVTAKTNLDYIMCAVSKLSCCFHQSLILFRHHFHKYVYSAHAI